MPELELRADQLRLLEMRTRETPLWNEYVQRGLVTDDDDWYKYFKCSEIDPTVLAGEEIHKIRSEGMRRLILYKLGRYPIQSGKLLKRFMNHMPARDVLHLLVKPFLGKKSGATKAEVLSRAVEHQQMKDSAAELTRLTDEEVETVARAAKGSDLGAPPPVP